MRQSRRLTQVSTILVGAALALLLAGGYNSEPASAAFRDEAAQQNRKHEDAENTIDARLARGEQTFRFDTFGDEAFWGDTLGLHKAIEGANLGGVGPGVSPRTALAAGLKVNLDDPATTVALLKRNAIVGVTGFPGNPGLRSIGIQCALCHSTVDDSLAPGIGHRLDGWANRDLNVGAIVALAPNLQPVADLLG